MILKVKLMITSSLALLSATLLVVSFQNCSKPGSSSSDSGSLSSSSPPTTIPSQDRVLHDWVVAEYKSVLERTDAENAADAAGIAYWVDQLKKGLSYADFDVELKNSNEYFVRQLFHSALHRPADIPGLAYYKDLLDKGAKTRTELSDWLNYVCAEHLNGECQ